MIDARNWYLATVEAMRADDKRRRRRSFRRVFRIQGNTGAGGSYGGGDGGGGSGGGVDSGAGAGEPTAPSSGNPTNPGTCASCAPIFPGGGFGFPSGGALAPSLSTGWGITPPTLGTAGFSRAVRRRCLNGIGCGRCCRGRR